MSNVLEFILEKKPLQIKQKIQLTIRVCCSKVLIPHNLVLNDGQY